MSFFQIQNAYSEKINDDLNSKSEFEINSDVFDTELLKFQQNLKKLDLKKMQCNLTNTMIILQITIMK